jgi:hypothetical protein
VNPRCDDLRQARELAMLVSSSEEAIETFIAYCDVAARDLLFPYGDVVVALCMISSSHRRLRAIALIKRSRRSARSGRMCSRSTAEGFFGIVSTVAFARGPRTSGTHSIDRLASVT